MVWPADEALPPTLEAIGLSFEEPVPSDLPFELGETVYYTHLEDELHLNGATIALGPDHVASYSDEFPMLTYYPEGSPGWYGEARPEPVVLLFESGTVVIPRTPDEDRARELIREPLDHLAELDLVEVPAHGDLDVARVPTTV